MVENTINLDVPFIQYDGKNAEEVEAFSGYTVRKTEEITAFIEDKEGGLVEFTFTRLYLNEQILDKDGFMVKLGSYTLMFDKSHFFEFFGNLQAKYDKQKGVK